MSYRDDEIIVKKENEEVYVDCHHCRGDGETTAQSHPCCVSYNGLPDEYYDINKRVRCCTCRGSGKVKL